MPAEFAPTKMAPSKPISSRPGVLEELSGNVETEHPTGEASEATSQPDGARRMKIGAAANVRQFLGHWALVLADACKQWMADRAMTLGSSLAYYTLFSLAPLLLFAISLSGLVFGGDQARTGIIQELNDTLGADVALAIDAILHGAKEGRATTVTLFGLGMLLFGASGAFVELQSALNLIWKVKEPPSGGIAEFFRARMLSIGAVVGMGFLLLVSLVLSSGLSIAGRFAGDAVSWQVVNVIVSLGLITLVFALVYRLLPDAFITWDEVWGGALVAALLFTLGKQIFSLYLSQAGVTSMYGSAGSVIVVLLWVYYSALILLFGAEVAHAHAALRKRDRPAVDKARDANLPLSSQFD